MSGLAGARPSCAPLPSAAEMAVWDRAAVQEGGACAVKLMANAGEGALRCLKSAWAERLNGTAPEQSAGQSTARPRGRRLDMPVLQGVKILLFMGRGNNGGDAAVLARLALREGADVLLCHLHALPEEPPAAQDAAGVHVRDALACGVATLHLPGPEAPLPSGWEAPDIIVDGLLGTGFSPPLRPEFEALIKRINALSQKSEAAAGGGNGFSGGTAAQAPNGAGVGASFGLAPGPASISTPKMSNGLACKAWRLAGQNSGAQASASGQARPAPLVLALDIPSGLCAVKGTPSPVAVASDITITFEAPKPGLLLPPAFAFTGKLLIHPVGIPLSVQAKYPATLRVLLPGCALAGRSTGQIAHKGRAGRVLIIGGSAGFTGAPHLSALAALRSGAGLVSIACPAGLNAQVKYHCPDIMTIPVGKGLSPAPEDWRESFAYELAAQVKDSHAVVIGPGLGLSAGGHAFLAMLLSFYNDMNNPPPLVLDADALTMLADIPEIVAALPLGSVFTPHPGEAARLLKTATAAVEADRMAALAGLTDMLPGTVLLKGAGTLIGRGRGGYLLPFIEPNLAVGGSGDVLSGIIATYLAQGAEALSATCAGAYVHGLCGHILREAAPARGNLASGIAAAIPRARAMAAHLPGHWLPAPPPDFCQG